MEWSINPGDGFLEKASLSCVLLVVGIIGPVAMIVSVNSFDSCLHDSVAASKD
jgi:hypothetical protein